MSSVSDHRAKAEHNEKLADTCVAPYCDWAVTMTFYAALHYIEAFFAKQTPSTHSLDHTKRDSAIARSAFLKPMWKDYRELKNQSKNARYEAHMNFLQSDVDNAKKRLNILKSAITPKL